VTNGLGKLVSVASFSSGSWPITAAAPQRIRTVFPFFPFLVAELGNLSKLELVLLISDEKANTEKWEFLGPI
jgi:hypothetical protein